MTLARNLVSLLRFLKGSSQDGGGEGSVDDRNNSSVSVAAPSRILSSNLRASQSAKRAKLVYGLQIVGSDDVTLFLLNDLVMMNVS